MNGTIFVMVVVSAAAVKLAVRSSGQPSPQSTQTVEASAGFDDQSNGFSDPAGALLREIDWIGGRR